MKYLSRTALVAVAVALGSAIVVTTAVAATTPEFKPVPSKHKFTAASSKAMEISLDGTGAMICRTAATVGEVTSAETIGKVIITYKECSYATVGPGSCPVHSLGAKEGEIVTGDLTGELGTVPTSEAPSGVGILLKGEHEKKWTTLVGTTCYGERVISGTAIAEIPVIGKKQTTNELVFPQENIFEIKLDSGKKGEGSLSFGYETGVIQAKEEVKFEEAIEVT